MILSLKIKNLLKNISQNLQPDIEDTPKQHDLFNLWCDNRYFDTDEITIHFMRRNRKRKGKHKSNRWAQTGLVNLNFFYGLAKSKKIYFNNYEKRFLSLSLLTHRDQIYKEKGKFLDKIRNILLDMIMIRLGRIYKDMDKWSVPNEKSIQETLNLINDPDMKKIILNSISIEDSNLKIQSLGPKKLSKIIQDIESGKNRYKFFLKEGYEYLPENIKESFYHIIYFMPLTLAIKVLKLYLPFSVGNELLRTKVYEINYRMRNPNHEFPLLDSGRRKDC